MLTIAANSDRWLCEWYFRNLLFVCFFTVITDIMINVILVLMVLLITATSFTVITVWGEVRRMLLFNTGIANSNTVTSSTGFTWRNTRVSFPWITSRFFHTCVSFVFFFLFFLHNIQYFIWHFTKFYSIFTLLFVLYCGHFESESAAFTVVFFFLNIFLLFCCKLYETLLYIKIL